MQRAWMLFAVVVSAELMAGQLIPRQDCSRKFLSLTKRGDAMTNHKGDQRVLIEYTNWRGERSHRVIRPQKMLFGSNEWHPEEQWLLEAFDEEKGALRTFAVKSIHSWAPTKLSTQPAL